MVQGRPFPRSHEGHDGFTIDGGSGTSGIAGTITDRAMSSYHPDIVLLMIGTNDVNGNVDVANALPDVADVQLLASNAAGYAVLGDSFYDAISAFLP